VLFGSIPDRVGSRRLQAGRGMSAWQMLHSLWKTNSGRESIDVPAHLPGLLQRRYAASYILFKSKSKGGPPLVGKGRAVVAQ
jgi:hypothetical protein